MKTIKKQLKRAFTIVELVIVIAVVAALAAILIPTFVNVVNSANESNDISMLYNINLALSAETDIVTPEDALDVAAETGYNIDKLTPSSDGEIVYDGLTKSFALVADDAVVYPTSSSSLDLKASTTWYFASSQDDIKSSTASYIIIGTWYSDVVYEGTGQIDTSRATIYGGVVVGVDTTTNNTGYVGAKGSLAAKKLTADGNSTKTIILNIVSGYAIYIYPASDVKYVIYSDADFYFSEEVSPDTYTVARGSGEFNEEIEYVTATEEGKSSGLAIAGQIISEICTQNDAANAASFVLELGTEKYPYLLSTADDVVAIKDKVSTDRKVYFKLNNNIDMKDITTGSTYYGTLKYECEIDLSGYTIKAYDGKQVFGASTSCDAVIKDSSSAGTGAIFAEGNDLKYLISFTANNAKITLESGNIYAKNSTLNYIVYLSGANSNTQFIMNGGSIYSENSTISSGLVQVGATNASQYNISFIMNGGTISSEDTLSAIAVYSRRKTVTHTVTINGGTIKAGDYCIAGSGQDSGSSTITINGGTINSTTDYAIYNPQNGTVTISGGTISGGAGAVCMNKGTLTVSGGELICTGKGNTGDASDGTGNLENAVINLGAEYSTVTCTISGCKLTTKSNSAKIITIGGDVASTGNHYTVTLTVGTNVTITQNGTSVTSGYISLATGYAEDAGNKGTYAYSAE